MKDKRYFSPVELIQIASQHAYSAQQLLKDNAEILVPGYGSSDTLNSVTSLMYTAFELSLKSYLLQSHAKNNQYKNLVELLELTPELGLSDQEQRILKKLARQQAFRKGVDYELWENRQQLQVFCVEIIELFDHLQQLLPLELQREYQ